MGVRDIEAEDVDRCWCATGRPDSGNRQSDYPQRSEQCDKASEPDGYQDRAWRRRAFESHRGGVSGTETRYIRPSRIGGSSARVAAAPCSDDGGAEHEGDPGHLEAAEIVSEKHPTDDHSDGKLGAADHRGRPFAGAGSAP